ncbi:unnamed protein product [Callosobruchus maculatus]|uniref:SH2 domain-containing protein n=1 Tax=Callosobruchus maculatus TaxID=64391 RepID=A0A653CZS2_CALMS|nr:unnamed protein product [Callosobruchus maculatus]
MGGKGPSRQRLFVAPPSSGRVGRNKLHKVGPAETDKHRQQIKQTMDKFKQMCWCFKVFFRVAANLTGRACDEASHALYKMCCVFCWCSDRGTTVGKDSTVQELIRGSTEEFYKELTRQSAEELLRARQNGTFVIRLTIKSISPGGAVSNSGQQNIPLKHQTETGRFDSIGERKTGRKVLQKPGLPHQLLHQQLPFVILGGERILHFVVTLQG